MDAHDGGSGATRTLQELLIPGVPDHIHLPELPEATGWRRGRGSGILASCGSVTMHLPAIHRDSGKIDRDPLIAERDR